MASTATPMHGDCPGLVITLPNVAAAKTGRGYNGETAYGEDTGGDVESARDARRMEFEFYNVLLRTRQRSKPMEMQHIEWNEHGQSYYVDPETAEMSWQLPDEFAWVATTVENLKNNLLRHAHAELKEKRKNRGILLRIGGGASSADADSIVDSIVDAQFQDDGLLWYNLNTGETSFTVPVEAAWERRPVVD